MARNLTHWINGKHVEGTSGRFGDVYNPATGEVESQAPLASEAELAAAVEAAKAAFPDWAATPPLTRARIMFK
ncbi:MAG: aldehyde dehydrogenase family protein, partial [Alphaproteobacteria bacterium]